MRPAEETPPLERKTVQDGDQDHPIRALNAPQDRLQDRPHDGFDRLTVAQAAERLQITRDAVRKRIARGTIVHDKDDDGRIFVYLDTFERASKTVQDEGQEDTSKTVQDAGQDKYTRNLEDQVEFLRRESERKDAIIMQMAQANAALAARVPELEGQRDNSPDERESRETVSDNAGDGTSSDGEKSELRRQRSWWYRLFVGD